MTVSTKSDLEFSIGDSVVYPAHGVGAVVGVETQEVAGYALEVYVITFDHEKMTLRVPTKKAKTAGLRALAAGNVVSQALTTLKGRARVKRTMWSRRAQEQLRRPDLHRRGGPRPAPLGKPAGAVLLRTPAL
jgi:CarD family transcriptional regulator